MFAVANMHTDCVNALLKCGADVNATAKDGGTALMLAASSDATEIVQALLSKGANAKEHFTQDGKTALMLATERGHLEIAELLRAAGAE